MSYDTYFSKNKKIALQLKVGPCGYFGYSVGEMVSTMLMVNAHYHDYGGVVIIWRGELLDVIRNEDYEWDNSVQHYTKWGHKFRDGENLDDFNPAFIEMKKLKELLRG